MSDETICIVLLSLELFDGDEDELQLFERDDVDEDDDNDILIGCNACVVELIISFCCYILFI